MLVGNMLAMMLWGIEALQLVWYFVHYGDDPIFIKLYTLFLFAVGTAQIAVLFALNYVVLITHYGNVKFMLQVQPLGDANISLLSVVSLLSQTFFVFRIFKFAERPIFKYGMPFLLAPLIVYQFIGLQLYLALGVNFSSLTQSAKLEEYIISSFGVQSAVDISIAVIMCTLLYVRRTGLNRADRFLSDLILASIYTGACTAILAISIIIIIQVTTRQQLTFATPFSMLPSMYVNSVLCNLNIRKFIRKHGRGKADTTISLTSVKFRSGNADVSGQGEGRSKNLRPMPSFTISRETHQDQSTGTGDATSNNSSSAKAFTVHSEVAETEEV